MTKVGQHTDKVTPIQLPEILSHFDKQLPTLLFVGGSGGAKVFNNLISQHAKTLTEGFNIINLTGDARLNQLDKHIYRVDYITELYQPLMDFADVVVTRGGSNTLFELIAMKNCISSFHSAVKQVVEIRLKMLCMRRKRLLSTN